jgi:hypothetical protein
MAWTLEKPETPQTGSAWYWYWDPSEKDPCVTEIYKGCWKYFAYDGYWWDEPVKRPPETPEFKKKEKVKKKRKKKAKQVSKTDNSKKQEMQSALLSMPSEEKPSKKFRGRGIL